MERKSNLLQVVYNDYPDKAEAFKNEQSYKEEMEKNNRLKIESIKDPSFSSEFTPPEGMQWDEYGNPEFMEN